MGIVVGASQRKIIPLLGKVLSRWLDTASETSADPLKFQKQKISSCSCIQAVPK